jgi:hypothetical protein
VPDVTPDASPPISPDAYFFAALCFAQRAFCASEIRFRAAADIFLRRRFAGACPALAVPGWLLDPRRRSAANPRPAARNSGKAAKICAASVANSDNRCSAPTTA